MTPQSWTVGSAIAPITVPAANGNPAPTYTAVGSLPAGIAFNTTTRVLSGTPTAVGSGTITIRATNSEGAADWTVTYTASASLVAPSFVDDTGDNQTWTQNVGIMPLTVPAANGNPTPTYAAVGNLPTGIAFNTTTRVLSGTPTVVGSGAITIRATNSEGFADWTVDYATAAPNTAPSFTDDTGVAQAWVQSLPIGLLTVPAASGNPTPTYAAVGTLPAGITFNSTTRFLSGTPTVVGSGTIRIRATNSEGFDDWTVSYTTVSLSPPTPVAAIAEYRLEVDWDGDLTFGNSEADVYPRVSGAVKAKRGRNFTSELYGRATAGVLSFTLYNDDNKFDRLNTNSPLYGLVVAGRAIRLNMRVSPVDPYVTIWGGFLDDPKGQPRRGGNDLLKMQARGLFVRLTQTRADTPVESAISTGNAVSRLFDASDLDASLKGSVSTSGVSLERWWGDGFAMAGLESLEETEGGFVFEDKLGRLGFETRNDRVGTARNPVLTLTTQRPGAGETGVIDAPSDDPIEEVVNEVRVTYRGAYTVESSSILWTLSDTPQLAAGEFLELVAEYPVNTSPQGHVAVDSWDPIQTGDAVANSRSDGGGLDRTSSLSVVTTDEATSRTLVVTNIGAVPFYITTLRVRGQALVQGDQNSLVVRNQASIDNYERKSYPLDAAWLGSANEATTYGDWILLLRKDPQRKVKTVVNMNNHLAVARDLELSQFVAFHGRDSTLGLFVDTIGHHIQKGGRHDVILTMTPATVFGNIMILNTGMLNTNILGG